MPYPIRNEQLWRRQATTAPSVPGTTPAPSTPAPTSNSPTETSTTPTSTSTSSPTTETSATSSSSSSTPDDPTSNTSRPTSRPPNTSTPPTSGTPNPGTSVPPASQTPIVSTSLSQSVFTTVITVTDGNGNVVTSASVTSSSVPVLTTQAGNNGGGSKSNTGAIVGGIVGGLAGLGILILLLWCWKRRSKDIKLDENIFDPDRNVQRPGRLHGDVDLADAEARPYSIQPLANAPRPNSIVGAPEMSQVAGVPYNHPVPPNQVPYGATPYPAARPTSQYSPDFTSYPTSDGYSSVLSPSSAAGLMSPGTNGRTSYPPSTTDRSVTTTSHNPRSAKEREVAARHALQVANTEDDGSSAVVQHRDGGRIEEQRPAPEPPREVPPAYDSIPHSPEPSGSAGAATSSRPAVDTKRPYP